MAGTERYVEEASGTLGALDVVVIGGASTVDAWGAGGGGRMTPSSSAGWKVEERQHMRQKTGRRPGSKPKISLQTLLSLYIYRINVYICFSSYHFFPIYRSTTHLFLIAKTFYSPAYERFYYCLGCRRSAYRLARIPPSTLCLQLEALTSERREKKIRNPPQIFS